MTDLTRCWLASVVLLICLGACDSRSADSANPQPASASAQRIVTLSPHLAELVFAVGAGAQIVGVSAFTDYPDAATRLPVVGDAFNLDQEQLTLLQPDILLAWDTGTPAHVIDELRSRGYAVEIVTTTALSDIPLALERIGELTGRQAASAAAAAAFNDGLAEIARSAADASPISVFYQVDARPLYTINGTHFVSQLIALCGGQNIFRELDGLAPLVSVEAVLERNPEVILASTDAGSKAFNEWDRWTDMAANRYSNRFQMPANDIGRPTPRLLDGARAVCRALDEGRRNRLADSNE